MVVNEDALHLFHLRSFQLHLTCGRFLLPGCGQLHELLPRPVRQVFFVQHADELVSVPACRFAVTQTGAAHRAANGVRRTAKTVMGIPELVFLTPAGFLQRVGAEYQHLAGIVLLGAVTDTMLRAKEI